MGSMEGMPNTTGRTLTAAEIFQIFWIFLLMEKEKTNLTWKFILPLLCLLLPVQNNSIKKLEIHNKAALYL